MEKIIYISTALSDAHTIQRITSLYNSNMPIEVYGYNRGFSKCNKLPEGLTVTVLGDMTSGSGYIEKIKRLYVELKRIIKTEGKDNVLFVCSGFMTALLLYLNGVKYVYELPDLLYGYPKFNKLRPIFKLIDKRIIKKSALTLLTSDGFRKYFLGDKTLENVYIYKNKLNPSFIEMKRPSIQDADINHLRFAYVGAPRSKNTVLRFAKTVGELFPQHEFHFFGDSPKINDFISETKQYKNVIYHGAFKNPDDLANIYNQLDIVVATYEIEALNERILDPNKLYEAIYFSKPIVVSKGSYLAENVESLKCGFAINAYSEMEIIDFISTLNEAEIKEIMSREFTIDKGEVIEQPNELADLIRLIV